MTFEDKRLEWAAELQFLSQCAMAYCKDKYDIERFKRIREISAEMAAASTGLPVDDVRDVFCAGSGYQTPKLDTRAAVLREGRLLLVQEADGRWALPGGWVDYDLTLRENAAKEVLEEAGKISRFHGGAAAGKRATPTAERGEVAECRRVIARCAAALVRDGDSLLINGSNTALALLDHLGGKNVSVFTNNGLAVGHRYPPGVEVQLSGGMFRGAPHILTGHTKVGKAGTYASFHLEKKGCVITDEHAPQEVLDQLRAAGMEIRVARAADYPDHPGEH